jgi:hypothetical protein
MTTMTTMTTMTPTEQLHLVHKQHEAVVTYLQQLERLKGELAVAKIAIEAGKIELAHSILASVRARRASARKRFKALEAEIGGLR